MAIEKWGTPKTVSPLTRGADEGKVTALPNGGYVVVWDANGITSVQVYDGLGNPVGARQDIASTVGNPRFPKVTVLHDGSFVVAWSGASTTIQAQKFSITGAKDGGLFTIADEALTTNNFPSLASGSTGWVAVWAQKDSEPDPDQDSIQFLRQNGTKFSITVASGVTQPDVVELTDGRHVVTWEESGRIKVALVNANNSVQVLTDAHGGSSAAGNDPTITALSNGGFVVSWQDANARKFSTQVYNAQGNQVTTGSIVKQGDWVEYPPEVVGLTKGGFAGGYAVVYEDWVEGTNDIGDIYLQLVKADGTIVGPTLINDGALRKGSQWIASVTELPDGRISIVWDDGTVGNGVIRNQIIDAREIAVTVNGSSHNDIYIGTKFSGDVLYGKGGIDKLYGGAGDDVLVGGAGADILDGDVGTSDWASYSDATVNVLASLRGDVGTGDALGDVYVGIENLRGTDVAGKDQNGEDLKDILIGNAAANRLDGGLGVDWLYGGAGVVGDVFIGGDTDTIVHWDYATYQFSNAGTGIVLDFVNRANDVGEAKFDTFTGIDAYGGTNYADRMRGYADRYNEFQGNAGNDYLTAGNVNDYLGGGEGNDTLEGGASTDALQDALVGGNGNDFVSYAGAGAGVLADLVDTGRNTGDADGDVYTSIEGLIGSAHSDRLYGNDAGNELRGGASVDELHGMLGSDTLEGGLGSDNLFGGGVEIDFASYANAGGAVAINLATGLKTGEAAGDVYSSIEGLIGSDRFGDTLFGDAGNNHLRGLGGNDQLFGAAGIDTLDGGAGNDVYVIADGDVVVELSGGGLDTILTSTSLDLRAFAHVEYLEATTRSSVTLTGSSDHNVITGNAGRDTLKGEGGNDRLRGGTGADVMYGGTGNDTFYVDNKGDRTLDGSRGGTDTVYTSVSFALGTTSSYQIEKIIAVGRTGISLTGNKYDNAITGNSGANKLYGGSGNDQLKGGSGKDGFVFNTKLSQGSNVDKVLDFKSRDDSFFLDNKYFTKLGSGSSRGVKIKSDMFIEGKKAQDAEDRIVYDRSKGALYYDKDGVGGSSQVKIATLSNKEKLYYHDFFVI